MTMNPQPDQDRGPAGGTALWAVSGLTHRVNFFTQESGEVQHLRTVDGPADLPGVLGELLTERPTITRLGTLLARGADGLPSIVGEFALVIVTAWAKGRGLETTWLEGGDLAEAVRLAKGA